MIRMKFYFLVVLVVILLPKLVFAQLFVPQQQIENRLRFTNEFQNREVVLFKSKSKSYYNFKSKFPSYLQFDSSLNGFVSSFSLLDNMNCFRPKIISDSIPNVSKDISSSKDKMPQLLLLNDFKTMKEN